MAEFDLQTSCPYCGDEHDATSGVGHEHTPEEGSLSLCIRCANPSMFVKQVMPNGETYLTTRQLTGDEWDDIVKDEWVAKSRLGVIVVNARK